MCFRIRYNEIFSHHIFSKANIPCVCLGAARWHRPSGYTGTKRTSWTDGEWRTKGRVESLHVDGEILSELHLMFHHIVWLAVFLQGVEGALGPTGIIGPSGHPVCISYPILCRALCTFCCQATMEQLFVYFLSIREPRVTEEVRGRWCVAPLLINPPLSSVSLD